MSGSITQLGQTNAAAQVVPGFGVVIVPPAILALNGVPSNDVGVVGSAPWGPDNLATTVGTYAEYIQLFGGLVNRKYDMGTAIACAVQQGANNFTAVRVTDGTDVAAFVTPSVGTIESFYSLVGGTSYSTGVGNLVVLNGTGSGAVLKLVYSSGTIGSVTVVAGGTGWGASGTTATVVSGSASAGTGAVLTVTVTSGVITAVGVTTAGSAYPTGPTMTLCTTYTTLPQLSITSSGGIISAINILNSGAGLISNLILGLADSTGSGASASIATGAITLTSFWTGSAGNSTTATVAISSNGSGVKVTIQNGVLGIVEIFDNIVIPGGGTVWANMVSAINNGLGTQSASQLVIASAAGNTGGPIYAQTYSLAGGTDGASGVTATTLIGVDGTTRTGMYALRGQNCQVGVLADCDTASTWSNILAFGLAEGIYFGVPLPAGETISAAVTAIQGAGVVSGNSYALKVFHGDWIWWSDPVLQLTRLVSPVPFWAGLMGNLAPNQSSLNKQLFGIVGSQKSGIVGGAAGSGVYSLADLQTLALAGIDVITNPQPGGYYWGCRIGHNCSSNAGVHGDNYTRMTNFLAQTLLSGMGVLVGDIGDSDFFLNVSGTLNTFLGNLLFAGLLSPQSDGSNPFSVLCNATNNPQSRTGLGYFRADVQIRYQAIVEFLSVGLQGGQTVLISRTTAPQQ